MRKVFLMSPLTDQLAKFISPFSNPHAFDWRIIDPINNTTAVYFRGLQETGGREAGGRRILGPEACDECAASSLLTQLSGAASI